MRDGCLHAITLFSACGVIHKVAKRPWLLSLPTNLWSIEQLCEKPCLDDCTHQVRRRFVGKPGQGPSSKAIRGYQEVDKDESKPLSDTILTELILKSAVPFAIIASWRKLKIYKQTRCCMPVYTYRCENCGVRFERNQKFSDPPLAWCPECGKKTLRKVYTPVGIVFKGSGFYATDHRSPSGQGRSSGHSESKSSGEESKPESKPAGDTTKTSSD